MNIFIAMGTLDFLKKIKEKYSGEKMVLLTNVNGALLIHETNGQTVFNEPQRYQILEAIGEVRNQGAVVLNHIPVTDEGRQVFEYQLKMNVTSIQSQPGFLAIKSLQPVDSNTYVLMTMWEDERNYLDWENSPSYWETNLKKHENDWPKIFEGAPHKSLYTIA